jgi:hypothetical protein
MSGRRIRNAIASAVPGATVIMLGLTNEYISYITTPEEYRCQRYEGSSTIYGQFTQPYVQERLRTLSMRLDTIGIATSNVTYHPTGGGLISQALSIADPIQYRIAPLDLYEQQRIEDILTGFAFSDRAVQFRWEDVAVPRREEISVWTRLRPQVELCFIRDSAGRRDTIPVQLEHRLLTGQTVRANVRGEHHELLLAMTASSSIRTVWDAVLLDPPSSLDTSTLLLRVSLLSGDTLLVASGTSLERATCD